MLQLLIRNYVLHTHTHTQTHTYAHTCMGIQQLHALGPPRQTSSPWTLHGGHTSPPVILLMKTVCELSLSHSGQVRVRAACPSLCGSLFASRNRFTVDGERTACVLPVKSVTGLFVTLFSKSESRCRKKEAGSRLRCALKAVGGSLQNIPTLDHHLVRDVICIHR